jgi:hypothetical protein
MSPGRWPGPSMTGGSALPIVSGSVSRRLSCLALRRRMTRDEAVKDPACIMCLQAGPPDRDGQVCLAASDVPVGHEVLGPVHELEAGGLFAAPVGGERGHAPVVSVECLGLGESGPSGAGGRVWIRPCWRSPSPDRPARKPSCPGVASSHARRSTSRVGGSVRASSMTCPGVAFGDRRLPVGAVVTGVSVVVVSLIVPPCICRIWPGPGRRACHRLAGCVPRWSRWSPGRRCVRP